ncbi:hypothetical protein CB1_000976001 [Camelus ferus]|nr:hypothetical protein CB1_000976001 [Camelus ferus]
MPHPQKFQHSTRILIHQLGPLVVHVLGLFDRRCKLSSWGWAGHPFFHEQYEELGLHQGPTEGTGDESSRESEEEQGEMGAGPADYSYQPLNRDPEPEGAELAPVKGREKKELPTSKTGTAP